MKNMSPIKTPDHDETTLHSPPPSILAASLEPFFDGVGDGQFVYDHVNGLIEAVDAVDGLFFYKLFKGVVD